jgi:signal transduction histidine kinase
VISAVHTSDRPAPLLPELARMVHSRLRRRAGRDRSPDPPSPQDALFRALCHDMHGSLACLESALHHVARGGPRERDLLELARSQAAHLSSLLRTAEATGGAPIRHPVVGRTLHEVVSASIAASGLPRRQLTVRVSRVAGDITVGDARLQRILLNLLENAHRHGNGESVVLEVTSRDGWVRLGVRQAGIPTDRVVSHLETSEPPSELTGLGLWSVQRQTHELGGRVTWQDDGQALTLTVLLPDR